MVFIPPSSVFSTTLPVKPSVTQTSTLVLITSRTFDVADEVQP